MTLPDSEAVLLITRNGMGDAELQDSTDRLENPTWKTACWYKSKQHELNSGDPSLVQPTSSK